MTHDPQYLIGHKTDQLFKAHQQVLASHVARENTAARKEIRGKKKDIKENYLTIPQCSRLGIKKSEILTWVREGKLQECLHDGVVYFARTDIVKCM